MAANLLFAYRIGVDKVYVESISGEDHFYSEDERGTLTLGAYGQPYKAFCARVAAEGERDYTHRDFLPDIAVVRFDDTYWGQGKNMPGRISSSVTPNTNPPPRAANGCARSTHHPRYHGCPRALLGALGCVPQTTLFVCTGEGAIVYDETVGYEHCGPPRCCFCAASSSATPP
jgi:hypothetical protein